MRICPWLIGILFYLMPIMAIPTVVTDPIPETRSSALATHQTQKEVNNQYSS